jgi:ABC-type transporter Mla MlaB component
MDMNFYASAMTNEVCFKLYDSANRPRRAPNQSNNELYNIIQHHLGDTIEYLGEYYGQTSTGYCIIFSDRQSTEQFVRLVEAQQLWFRGLRIQIQMAKHEVTLTLHGVAYTTTESNIEDVLAKFGSVLSISSGFYPGTKCLNGIKYVQMEGSLSNIPSMLDIRGTKVMVSYIGQTRTCFQCSSTGHMIGQCPNVLCHKCGGQGHLKRECVSPIYTSISTPQQSNPWRQGPEKEQIEDLSDIRATDSGMMSLGLDWNSTHRVSQANTLNIHEPSNMYGNSSNTPECKSRCVTLALTQMEVVDHVTLALTQMEVVNHVTLAPTQMEVVNHVKQGLTQMVQDSQQLVEKLAQKLFN